MWNPCVRTTLLIALFLAPGTLMAAPQDNPSRRLTMRYDIRFMDLHAAEVLAWDQCPQKERCRIGSLTVGGDSSRKGYLEVQGDAGVHERIARALAQRDAAPLTQSFQLLLLAASTKAKPGTPEVPASAQKALSDLKDFLPFKSYQLLDSAWLRTTQDRVTEGRVMGQQGTAYGVRLRFRSTGDDSLFVDFFDLKEEASTRKPPSKDQEGQPVAAPRAAQDLISTTFGLEKGETIVVGTSKVDGTDEALVVLLTAVPQQ